MSLFLIGVNHHTSGVAEREKMAFSSDGIPNAIDALREHSAIDEAVVLSTCNRTEIYTVTQCHHAVKEWLSHQHRQDHRQNHLETALYERHQEDVVKHLMTVASGADSMIIGESHILGQLKQAYKLADVHGAIGQRFRHLFPAAFATAKRVRAQTKIGGHSVTLTYAVMQLIRAKIPVISDATVVLIGSGETIELLTDYLYRHCISRLIILNRTLDRAHTLAQRYPGVVPMGMEAIDACLSEADLVISATTSASPIITREHIQRAQRPMTIIDLAIPRDVEPAVADVDSVWLYNMDDVQAIVMANQTSQHIAVDQARAMIELEAADYMRLLRVREASDMIRSYRHKMTTWRDAVLAKALAQLARGEDPALALTGLARNLTNKFMHQPTKKLREAAYAERGNLSDVLKEIYKL